MRQTTVALSTVLTAATLACILLFVLPKASQAALPPSEGGPSQGTFTQANAGPNEPSLVSDTPPSTSGELYTAASGSTPRWRVVRRAKRFLGITYRYATCTESRMSCTCLTKRTWRAFGHRLPMTEGGQWRYEPSRWIPRSNLRRGDIVFFKEAGWSNPITHVGIYSGKGNLVHASNYFNKVVESKMRYIKGYYGALRLRPR